MNSWKLRLLVIGFINLIISIIVFFTRPFELIIIGYMIVSLLVTVAGIVYNPKEKDDYT
ncbi:MAG: hypothetical protein ACFFEU_04295 [Candidatus Thorarchaeota archaeon]